MGADTERSAWRWKWIAVVAIASTALLLAALVVIVAFFLRPPVLAEERLIGTWQSDADRTIAAMRERRPVDEKQEAGLRSIFGKLQITYNGTAYTTEMEGFRQVGRYEVLGRDTMSVVIRDIENKPSPPDQTEFSVIQFDGSDSYWLYTKTGGVQEYFKRVK